MDFSKTHVLVIDDEPFVRKMMHRLLDMIGVSRISEASDGADGLTKLMTDPPDIVILDIMMEPMNGLKFLKTVRTGLMGGRPDLPVIVLTGSDEQAVFGTAMALDCNAFVSKAENLNVIKDRLTRALEEPIMIKESSVYQAIEVPNITIIVPIPDHPREAPPPPTKAYEVPIEEVQEGAIAARDVTTENGEILLTSGSVLSASYLNRLKDIAEIIELPSIWIEM
jgi:two-component system, chemotaxis family, chemotaxis protein CheY